MLIFNFHINGKQYGPLRAWLLAEHYAWGSQPDGGWWMVAAAGSFSLLCSILLYKYYRSFYIHSIIDGHLGRIQFSAVKKNSAVMNILGHVFWWI